MTLFKEMKFNTYRRVASSRPVYYTILELFGQRSQYISMKFPLHKPSENTWKCINRDSLLLATLQYPFFQFVTKFWNFLAKGHSTLAWNFPFISLLKI